LGELSLLKSAWNGSCRSLSNSNSFSNRKKCWAGLDFFPSGIDWIWMVVVCYWSISREWQVVLTPSGQ